MYKAIIETIWMSFSSVIVSYSIALPLGSLLVETSRNGMIQCVPINFILNKIIDIGRSIPFILLAILLFPITRMIVGTAIGTTATIIPLSVCAIPFETRLIEEILSQVPHRITEAALLDRASKIKVVVKIKWGATRASLVNCFTLSLINIIGWSTLAGVLGGGGLGNYAIVYGFQRFNWNVIFWSVLFITLLIMLIQTINNIIVRKMKKNDGIK